MDDARLDGRAHGHAQVGIQLAARHQAQRLLQAARHQGRAGGASDQQDFVDVGYGQMRSGEGNMGGVQRLGYVGGYHRLVVAARKFHRQVYRVALMQQQVFLGKHGVGMVG